MRPHVGAALRYAGHSVADFINGVGLYVQGDGMWALACPIRQQVIGYAPPGEAVGYRNAAALKGVTLEVWQ